MLRIYPTEQKGFFRTTQVNWRYLTATNMPSFDIFKDIQPEFPAMRELALSIPPLMGWEQVLLQIKLFNYLTMFHTTSMIYNLVDYRRRDEVV